MFYLPIPTLIYLWEIFYISWIGLSILLQPNMWTDPGILSPNFHIHVFVSDLHIPTIGLPILLQENM